MTDVLDRFRLEPLIQGHNEIQHATYSSDDWGAEFFDRGVVVLSPEDKVVARFNGQELERYIYERVGGLLRSFRPEVLLSVRRNRDTEVHSVDGDLSKTLSFAGSNDGWMPPRYELSTKRGIIPLDYTRIPAKYVEYWIGVYNRQLTERETAIGLASSPFPILIQTNIMNWLVGQDPADTDLSRQWKVARAPRQYWDKQQ